MNFTIRDVLQGEAHGMSLDLFLEPLGIHPLIGIVVIYYILQTVQALVMFYVGQPSPYTNKIHS